MPVDRNFWAFSWFAENNIPQFPCPRCQRSSLALVPQSLVMAGTSNTVQHQGNEDWEPEFWVGRFCCLLECNHARCRESISVVGMVRMADQDENGMPTPGCSPIFFMPPLHILPIPRACPEAVADELTAAFGLFWCDLPGAMNHLRKSVELILDRLRIPRQRLVTSGGRNRRRFLPLHDRIQRFRNNNPDLADRLEAVKWLGNEGSHGDQITTNDFFNALDLVEDFINEHFERRGRTIRSLTRSIIQRRGRH